MSRLILFVALLGGASVASAQATPARAAPGDRAQPPAYFEFQVERTALPLPGAPGPAYPAKLRADKVEGEVLAQFVVGADGRPEMTTFKVLKSSNALFTSAVYDAVQKMRFQPATIGGRAVKQVVQQPFVFSLAR